MVTDPRHAGMAICQLCEKAATMVKQDEGPMGMHGEVRGACSKQHELLLRATIGCNACPQTFGASDGIRA